MSVYIAGALFCIVMVIAWYFYEKWQEAEERFEMLWDIIMGDEDEE